MKVLVSDTSVLIDLDAGRLSRRRFAYPTNSRCPTCCTSASSRTTAGPDLIRLGLQIAELRGDQVALAVSYRRTRKSLSLPDSFALALALARTNSWALPQ